MYGAALMPDQNTFVIVGLIFTVAIIATLATLLRK
jgi:Tfp pilus assembly major pilin PilA